MTDREDGGGEEEEGRKRLGKRMQIRRRQESITFHESKNTTKQRKTKHSTTLKEMQEQIDMEVRLTK